MNVGSPLFLHLADAYNALQNLLQSLSAQRLRVHVQDADLKRLLSAVKEGRVRPRFYPYTLLFVLIVFQGHDHKLSDSFYDSLEGILNDLRAITIVCLSLPSWHGNPSEHAIDIHCTG